LSFYNVFFWGVPTVALASYLLLLFFFSIAKKDKVVSTFQLVLGSLALWTLCSLLMKLSVYPGELFWNRMMVAFTFATPLSIYIFLSIFTNTMRPGGLLFWSLVTLAGTAANFMGLMVSEAYMVNLEPGPGGFFAGHMELHYVTGPAGGPVLISQAAFIIAIILKARRCVIKNVSTYERIKPMLIGLSIMFLGVCANAVPVVGKYPLDILASFINSLLIIYGLYKNKMIEMRIMLTRGIVYSLTIVLMVFGYVYSVFSLERNIQLHFGEVSQYFIIASALLMALLFQPILGLINRLFERFFYKTEYRQRTALMDFSLNMSHNLNLNEISQQLIDTVEKAMNVQRSSLLLKDEESGDYRTFKSTVSLTHMDVTIVKDSPIVKWLTEKGGCLAVRDLDYFPQFKGVWDSEKRALDFAGVEVLVAVKCREQLVGIILLAAKRNNIPYITEDLELLASFGASTALAVENARLYTQAQTEAITDNLTGIYNHRYMFKYLSDLMDGDKKDLTVSVLNMDLDMFKLYNDLFGHSEGNSALMRVAEIISEAVDRRGIAVRFSGGNFIAVLPGHDPHQAQVIAEKIRSDVQKLLSTSM
jgi:GGDEF domain-containing protein